MKDKKFIAAGSCRRVFSNGDGTCVKIAISERLAAGSEQNRAEYSCLNAKDSSGNHFSCFPKAISSSEDFSQIEVEEVEHAADYMFDDAFSKYIDMNVVCSNDFKRLDSYQGIRIENSFVRWFAFVFCGFFDGCLPIMKNENVCHDTVEDVQAFVSSYQKWTAGIESLVDTSTKFLNEIVAQKDSNRAFKSLYDLMSFYLMYGRSQSFLLADLWMERQWGVRRSKETGMVESFVVLDAGYSKTLADSEHYRREKITPLHETEMTYPGSQPDRFDKKKLSEIMSPRNGRVVSKFYTKSEYIMTDDGMSTHIKHLNLSDDGKWPWSDKMTFMPMDKLTVVMRAIRDNMAFAKKLTFHDEGFITLEIPDGSEYGWTEVMRVDEVSYKPVIGLHVCEFTFDGFDGKSGIMKQYHPGHDVTWIEK